MSLSKMIILNILISQFFILSCNSNQTYFNNKIENKLVYFDSVQKYLDFDESVPDHFKIKLKYLFDNNFKTNGFEGSTEFNFKEFEIKEELVEDGKKVIIKISLEIFSKKKSIKSNKILKYTINEFGIIKGNFSIKDYEELVESVEISTLNSLLKIL